MGPAEGPVWIREGGYLLFSDINNDRRMRWDPAGGFSVDKQGTNRHNGLTRDRQGRLLACEHDGRRVTRIEADGSITVVANEYRGWRLNRPNDIVVRSDGSIFFTDPDTFQVDSELDLFGVYKVTPDLSRINLLVRDFVLPNGLAFSPGRERTLHRRLTQRPRQGLRRRAQRQAGPGDRPRAARPRRRRARRPGRHEGGRRRQYLLHWTRRDLHHRSFRQASGQDPDRRRAALQRRLGRRRLEDALLHHPPQPGQDKAEYPRCACVVHLAAHSTSWSSLRSSRMS